MPYLRPLLPLLAHYTLAPVAAHSFTMNLSIGFEVATATVLLIAVCRTLFRLPKIARGGRDNLP